MNPQSAGSVVFGTATTANLSLFQNTDQNGVWTFFIADLGTGGGTANLNNLVLTIVTVPEPKTAVMLIGGLAVFVIAQRHRNRWGR